MRMSAHSFIAISAICLLVLWSGAPPAPGADVEIADLEQSTWEAEYDGDGIGTPLENQIIFDGDKGRYRVTRSDGSELLKGRFRNVRYSKRSGNRFIIRGDWIAGSARGTFRFEVDGNEEPAVFDGTWKARSGQNGTWEGEMAPIPTF